MTGACCSKTFQQHDSNILPHSINPSPNSNPNRERGSWNQSPRSGRDPER